MSDGLYRESSDAFDKEGRLCSLRALCRQTSLDGQIGRIGTAKQIGRTLRVREKIRRRDGPESDTIGLQIYEADTNPPSNL
jgi:hypothetical protein